MSTLGNNVHIGRRPDGSVSLLRHNQAPFTPEMAEISVRSARNLARAYLKKVRPDYGFGADWLSTLDEDLEGKPRQESSRLRLRETKSTKGVRVVAYGQTYLGLPVWEAGSERAHAEGSVAGVELAEHGPSRSRSQASDQPERQARPQAGHEAFGPRRRASQGKP